MRRFARAAHNMLNDRADLWARKDPPDSGGMGKPGKATGQGNPGCSTTRSSGRTMLGTVLLIVLVLMLLGALPTWPHSRSWGYYPSGGLGLIVVILLILILLGWI